MQQLTIIRGDFCFTISEIRQESPVQVRILVSHEPGLEVEEQLFHAF
jgi:hypothetical protein